MWEGVWDAAPSWGGLLGAARALVLSSAASLRQEAAPHTQIARGRVTPHCPPSLLQHCRVPPPHAVPTGGLGPCPGPPRMWQIRAVLSLARGAELCSWVSAGSPTLRGGEG